MYIIGYKYCCRSDLLEKEQKQGNAEMIENLEI